jgi:hypothetical protein
MSERQLPWYVKRPHMIATLDGTREWKQHTVWDDAGHLVAECYGDEDGHDEACAIAELANRAGDKACAHCGEPATCFGSYEDELRPAYACDDCCGHGNEDGHCEPVSA